METKESTVLVYGEQIRGGASPPVTHTPTEKDWREYMDECRDVAKAPLSMHPEHYKPRWMAMLIHKPRLISIAAALADDDFVKEDWRQYNKIGDLHTGIKRALTGMAYMLGPDTTMKMMQLNGRAFITAALTTLDMETSPGENPALNMLGFIMSEASVELYPTDPRCGFIHLCGQVGIPFRFISVIKPIVDDYLDAHDEVTDECGSLISS